MIEKKIEINLLYDFYGELLTPRQKTALEQYYQDDLSFGEIAEDMEISRQAVFDTVRKAEHALYSYEEKLGLLHRFRQQNNLLHEILEEIEALQGLVPQHSPALPLVTELHQKIRRFIDQEVSYGSF